MREKGGSQGSGTFLNIAALARTETFGMFSGWGIFSVKFNNLDTSGRDWEESKILWCARARS